MSRIIDFGVASKLKLPVLDQKMLQVLERIIPEHLSNRILYFETVIQVEKDEKRFRTVVITDEALMIMPHRPKHSEECLDDVKFSEVLNVRREGTAPVWLHPNVSVRSQHVTIGRRSADALPALAGASGSMSRARMLLSSASSHASAGPHSDELHFFTFLERSYVYFFIKRVWLHCIMRAVRDVPAPVYGRLPASVCMDETALLIAALRDPLASITVKLEAMHEFGELLQRDANLVEHFWKSQAFAALMDTLRATLPPWSQPASRMRPEHMELAIVIMELLVQVLTTVPCCKSRMKLFEFAGLHSFYRVVDVIMRQSTRGSIVPLTTDTGGRRDSGLSSSGVSSMGASTASGQAPGTGALRSGSVSGAARSQAGALSVVVSSASPTLSGRPESPSSDELMISPSGSRIRSMSQAVHLENLSRKAMKRFSHARRSSMPSLKSLPDLSEILAQAEAHLTPVLSGEDIDQAGAADADRLAPPSGVGGRRSRESTGAAVETLSPSPVQPRVGSSSLRRVVFAEHPSDSGGNEMLPVAQSDDPDAAVPHPPRAGADGDAHTSTDAGDATDDRVVDDSQLDGDVEREDNVSQYTADTEDLALPDSSFMAMGRSNVQSTPVSVFSGTENDEDDEDMVSEDELMLHEISVALLACLEEMVEQADASGLPFTLQTLVDYIRVKPSFYGYHLPGLVRTVVRAVTEPATPQRSVVLFEHLHVLVSMLRVSLPVRQYVARNFDTDLRFLIHQPQLLLPLSRSALIFDRIASKYLHELAARCDLRSSTHVGHSASRTVLM